MARRLALQLAVVWHAGASQATGRHPQSRTGQWGDRGSTSIYASSADDLWLRYPEMQVIYRNFMEFQDVSNFNLLNSRCWVLELPGTAWKCGTRSCDAFSCSFYNRTLSGRPDGRSGREQISGCNLALSDLSAHETSRNHWNLPPAASQGQNYAE